MTTKNPKKNKTKVAPCQNRIFPVLRTNIQYNTTRNTHCDGICNFAYVYKAECDHSAQFVFFFF